MLLARCLAGESLERGGGRLATDFGFLAPMPDDNRKIHLTAFAFRRFRAGVLCGKSLFFLRKSGARDRT